MKKRLFLIPILLLIGIFTPTLSAADQSIVITDIADAGVETVLPATEPEPIAKVTAQSSAQTTLSQAISVTPVKTQATTPISVPNAGKPADSIQIAGKTLNITTVDSTTIDSGNHVNRFKSGNFDGRFLYGHNSATVFGGLKNLGVGNTFTVTLDGSQKTYKIAKIVIFNKNVAKGTIELTGDTTNYMGQVAKAKFKGVQYDLSIMTCHGQSLGGGDATERLVIFANKI